MALPKNNLSTLSQPWAREVEKLIVNTQSTLSKNEINNVARDAQLAASYRRLDTAVTSAAAAAQTANDAILGLTSLGSTSSEYTINAGNINAGTLTGVTVQTAATGRRVLMEDDDVRFFDADNQLSGIMAASGNLIVGAQLNISAGVTTRNISISNTTVALNTPNAKVSVSSNDNMVQLYSTLGTQVTGPFYASGASQFIGAVQMNSSLTTNGSTEVFGNLSTGGALTRTVLAGGGSTTATINNSGQFVRTTSSARYKQDIQPLEVNYDELLSLEPKRFRLKEEAAEDDNARFYAGFIAEEIDQTSLKDFVGYSKQEDGSVIPESVYYAEMTAALLAGLKKQDSMIKELQERVALLEAK